MENPLLGSIQRTVICCIVFVDIVGYSKKTTAKQLAMKEWFNGIISQCLHHVSPADRIILYTGDGAALCFLGDPEEALFVANSLRVAICESDYPEIELRIGINLGPVKLMKDINGQPNIVGDGINVAQRVMGFANPNQVLVSRSYYDVVSRLAEEYAHVFHYQGIHQDKHVREHEVYELSFLTAGDAAPAGVNSKAGAASEDLPRTEVSTSLKTNGCTERAERAQPVPFDERTLAGIATRLSQYLGPVAKLIVRRTATRTSGLAELCRMLAESIPVEQQRMVFLSSVVEFAGIVSSAPDTGLVSEEQELASDTLIFAEQLFAKYIGPMAKILVKKTAKTSRNAGELFQGLAGNIEDESQRRAFLAESAKRSSLD